MKLVREHIYEEFREKSDPIHDMGIGTRAQIKRWFEIYAPNANYTIDDNLNVKVRGTLNLRGTNVTELPDNLNVDGNLDLYKTPITKLPDNLSVEVSLDIKKTKITELPDNLYVVGKIYKDF